MEHSIQELLVELTGIFGPNIDWHQEQTTGSKKTKVFWGLLNLNKHLLVAEQEGWANLNSSFGPS